MSCPTLHHKPLKQCLFHRFSLAVSVCLVKPSSTREQVHSDDCPIHPKSLRGKVTTKVVVNSVAYPYLYCCYNCAKKLGSCLSRSKQIRPLLSHWHSQKNSDILPLAMMLKAQHTRQWGSLTFLQEQLSLMWSGQPGF